MGEEIPFPPLVLRDLYMSLRESLPYTQPRRSQMLQGGIFQLVGNLVLNGHHVVV